MSGRPDRPVPVERYADFGNPALGPGYELRRQDRWVLGSGVPKRPDDICLPEARGAELLEECTCILGAVV